MFVIERSGVSWSEKFYSGHNYMTSLPTWGPLEYAVEYRSKSSAVSMSYRIDDEEGIFTTVENLKVLKEEPDE